LRLQARRLLAVRPEGREGTRQRRGARTEGEARKRATDRAGSLALVRPVQRADLARPSKGSRAPESRGFPRSPRLEPIAETRTGGPRKGGRTATSRSPSGQVLCRPLSSAARAPGRPATVTPSVRARGRAATGRR